MSEFFAMGNHGFYVWGSYGVTALFMIAEAIIVMRSSRATLSRVTRLVRAESRTQSTGQ